MNNCNSSCWWRCGIPSLEHISIEVQNEIFSKPMWFLEQDCDDNCYCSTNDNLGDSCNDGDIKYGECLHYTSWSTTEYHTCEDQKPPLTTCGNSCCDTTNGIKTCCNGQCVLSTACCGGKVLGLDEECCGDKIVKKCTRFLLSNDTNIEILNQTSNCSALKSCGDKPCGCAEGETCCANKCVQKDKCCGGFTLSRNDKCCGDAFSYDPAKQGCCNGNLWDQATHQCCDGKKVCPKTHECISKGAGIICCPPGLVSGNLEDCCSPGTKKCGGTCCKLYQDCIGGDGKEKCCNKGERLTNSNACCSSNRIDKDNKCCPTGKKLCLDRVCRDRCFKCGTTWCEDEERCCGNICYKPGDKKCCGRNGPFETVCDKKDSCCGGNCCKPTEDCCYGECFDPFSKKCCGTGGLCFDHQKCCGKKCCDANQICIRGVCVKKSD